MTGRGAALTLLLALIAAAGVVGAPSGLSVAYAAGIALLSLLAYWRIVGVAKAAALSRLRVERVIEGHKVEGRKLRVKVEIRNPTPVPFEHIEVYDEPPWLWRIDGQPRVAVTLPARSRMIIEYDAEPVYGEHVFGPIRLVAYDPLGLFRVETRVGGETSVRIAPRTLGAVRGVYLVPSLPRPGGVAPGRRKGAGTTIYDVREYVPGDDTRLIDWKGFARTGRLLVKEFEQEVQVYTLLVLDVTGTMLLGALGETKLENTARVVRTIIEYVASRGDVYRVVVIDRDGKLYYTPWLRGRATIHQAVELLSSVKWGKASEEPPGEEELEARLASLRELARLAGREKTLIFVFTDAYESPQVAKRYAEVLSKLRLLHHDVQALIPLTAYFEVQLLSRDQLEASLYALLAYEKLREYTEIQRVFRRSGIPVVATGPVRLVETVLEKLEAYRRMLF
ncbi:protein of unknown function DUF58 [Pyrolobus fumarii 1A]|uniref:DUF58 domain-containing protein n=1 Tax=Pyrolobus fumarii (strain DSM 11204 / 1A) TaxID=694429 RepID=G0EF16_PYRF1|nr:DUF58 domain-containing protein [Pyrolobus fumarii]AEM38913.1 protein of unknown function DUF58 [Pyrolobus fumarii 1A]